MRLRSITVVVGVVGFLLGGILTPVLLKGQDSNPMEGTLAHIALAVHDADKTAAAFADVFGVEVRPGMVVRNVPFPPSYGGATMNVKFLQLTVNGVVFEILEPLDGPSPWKDFMEKHGEGIHHIGFNVADATAARVMLESKGGKWTQAASPTSAYVDMEPTLPFTLELFGKRPE